MPPKDTRRQDLTWSWACSTGHPATDQALDAAAQAAWPYAVLCAWTYLNDRDSAHDLMDHAVQNAADYLERHPGRPVQKLTARIKSVLRRRAKQLTAKRGRELSHGSLADLEQMYSERPEIEQRIYAYEVLAQLSPFANSIVHWRWLEYSWREIAKELGMDHTAVRRAYFRELESVVRSLSRPGASPQ
ncbi:MAG: sigma-70 family RNA polymerase sigma factor [Acidobacteria bacterium]|nr:sigma-70 family RNA polymerase sigma factor [Acidobacteriota bacterium]